MSKIVMWFRKDLRLDDNTAFSHLLKQSKETDEVMCIFQLNPSQFIKKSYNHDAFFLSVQTFYKELRKRQIPLHFLYGDPEENFTALKETFDDWDAVYFNKDERGFGRVRDQKLADFLSSTRFKYMHIKIVTCMVLKKSQSLLVRAIKYLHRIISNGSCGLRDLTKNSR
ncbi:deoxyribodipyrimidine photo-lyase [Enterococcus termitis]